MMTSSNENILRVTGFLCGEFTGHRWILRTKACEAELWYFLLICIWINCWVNNNEAGDLRCHRAHYDVIVMKSSNTNLFVSAPGEPRIYGSCRNSPWITGNRVCLFKKIKLNSRAIKVQVTRNDNFTIILQNVITGRKIRLSNLHR